MKPVVPLAAGALACLVLASCRPTDTGVIDEQFSDATPHLSAVRVTPAAVDLGPLPPASRLGTDSVTLSCTVTAVLDTATHPADVTAATVSLVAPDGTVLARMPMRNDGVAPDQTAGDSVFTATLDVSVLRRAAGGYRLTVQIANAAGNFDARTAGLNVTNSSNHRPGLFNLLVPDTVDIPHGDTIYAYRFAVSASDSDGLPDVAGVWFDVAAPDGRTTLALQRMYDDGNLALHGDSTAGDGVYSLLVRTDSTNSRGTTTFFKFYAIDQSGATSDTLRATIHSR